MEEEGRGSLGAWEISILIAFESELGAGSYLQTKRDPTPLPPNQSQSFVKSDLNLIGGNRDPWIPPQRAPKTSQTGFLVEL